MPFINREQAARMLARKLRKYRGKNPLILAIPRGAIPMAKIIAGELGGEVDVALVRKIGYPGNPEFAIGSVDEDGKLYLNKGADVLGIEDYIEEEKQRQLQTIRGRRKQYTPVRPPIDLAERIVIVVDDGIATGATMIAALRMVKAKNPKKLIAAAAVIPPDTAAKLKEFADEVVVLETPVWFQAVGQFFHEFPQVSDEEVIELLRTDVSEPSSRHASPPALAARRPPPD